MNLDDLTFGEFKQLSNLIGDKESCSLSKKFIGKKCIVRTYSAGVFFGEIVDAERDEVIIKNSRRLYRWQTKNNGISLSEVANEGLDLSKSKLTQPEKNEKWCVAIELIPCCESVISEIEGAHNYVAR